MYKYAGVDSKTGLPLYYADKYSVQKSGAWVEVSKDEALALGEGNYKYELITVNKTENATQYETGKSADRKSVV